MFFQSALLCLNCFCLGLVSYWNQTVLQTYDHDDDDDDDDADDDDGEAMWVCLHVCIHIESDRAS